MAENSAIEWTDHTFNPWIGCTKVSAGCDNCYAETLATRRLGVAWGPHAERRRTAESTWRQPLAWNRKAERTGQRYRVFCASLADVFDNQVPDSWLEDLWRLIIDTPHLDWLLLTKRPQLIRRRLREALAVAESYGPQWQAVIDWVCRWLAGDPPPNVWLGTTVENQAEADRRIPHLLAVPAVVRFLSCEPLLGPVNLPFAAGYCRACNTMTTGSIDGHSMDPDSPCFAGEVGVDAMINWVIAGGESGPGARPMHPDWARSLRDQCATAGVPFFFKQWGEWAPAPWKLERASGETDAAYMARSDAEGATHAVSRWGHLNQLDHRPWSLERAPQRPPEHHGLRRVGKKAAGAALDGREHRAFPEAPTNV